MNGYDDVIEYKSVDSNKGYAIEVIEVEKSNVKIDSRTIGLINKLGMNIKEKQE